MNIYTLSAKNCMSHLLLKETFDSFLFIDGEITTFCKFTMDGFLQKEFYDEAPGSTYAYWMDLREHCFGVIRGKRTPLSFKIVLSLDPADFPAWLSEYGLTSFSADDLQGLYLNFRYDGTSLQCITGISMNTFTLDKSVELKWDAYVKDYLSRLELIAE